MARSQTVLSELVVALGILGKKHNDFVALLNITNVSPDDIIIYKDEHKKRSFSDKESLIALEESGLKIHRWILKTYGLQFPIKIKWVGHQKVGTQEQAGKDLEIENANWRISVKEDSNILLNGSAERVFDGFPAGDFAKRKGSNWFMMVAPDELNNYYQECKKNYSIGYVDVETYFEESSKNERESFGKHVSKLHSDKNNAVLSAYEVLCKAVGMKSAAIFNKKFSSSKKERNFKDTKAKIFHQFFRINGVKYILAGTYNKEPFAQVIMPSDEWEKSYKFVDITAIYHPAGQPEVFFNFIFEDVRTKYIYTYAIRAEIRWSHGKFCGNPESKLYQKWDPRNLPWVDAL